MQCTTASWHEETRAIAGPAHLLPLLLRALRAAYFVTVCSRACRRNAQKPRGSAHPSLQPSTPPLLATTLSPAAVLATGRVCQSQLTWYSASVKVPALAVGASCRQGQRKPADHQHNANGQSKSASPASEGSTAAHPDKDPQLRLLGAGDGDACAAQEQDRGNGELSFRAETGARAACSAPKSSHHAWVPSPSLDSSSATSGRAPAALATVHSKSSVLPSRP